MDRGEGDRVAETDQRSCSPNLIRVCLRAANSSEVMRILVR